MPSKLHKAIRAIKDQTSIGLAHVACRGPAAFADLEVAVLKATSHEEVPVNDRHVTEVLLLTAVSPSAAAAAAASLSRRISRTRNWIVVLKSLSVAASAIVDAGPDFRREVAAIRLFSLYSFRNDDSQSSPWDFTAFVRTFALYLDARLHAALQGHISLRRYRHRRAPTVMKPSVLIERIGHWQRILDRAIGTKPTGPARKNRLILISLYTVIRESFDAYRDIVEGLSLLLDNFGQLPLPLRVETFDGCTRAAKQFEELDVFYAFCKKIGVGRPSEYPNVQKISNNLLEALDKFLKDHKDSPIRASPSAGKTEWESVGSMANSSEWEMILSESARQSSMDLEESQKTTKIENWSPISSYTNPFVDDRNERSSVVSSSSSPQQALTLFSDMMGSKEKMVAEETAAEEKAESDSFDKSAWVQKLDASVRQQMIQEQQLWLQHQSKIIEKNLAW